MPKITFTVYSDLHVGDTTIEQIKLKQLPFMMADQPQVVIFAGDLTDTGSGEGTFNCCCFPCGQCPCYKLKDDQWKSLTEKWITPFSSQQIQLLMCYGNHDGYSIKWPYDSPVITKLKQMYGNVFYRRKIGELNFISCGKYPDATCLVWLQQELQKIGKYESIIMFFHYNITGECSDWWSEDEKNKFYDVIKEYDVIGIFSGHWHETMNFKWNTKQIPCFCVGGTPYALCEYENGVLSVSFKNKDVIIPISK